MMPEKCESASINRDRVSFPFFLTEMRPDKSYSQSRKERSMLANRDPLQHFGVADFAGLMGISVRSFDRMRRDGLVPAPDVRFGRRLAWRRDTVQGVLDRLGKRPT
jgi:hypothetical protein